MNRLVCHPGTRCLGALVLALGLNAGARAGETLHYLTVGVSEYQDSANNLRFAHQDAVDVAAVCRRQQGKLFGNVEGETLLNAQATVNNILQGLNRLTAKVKPGDKVVIFLSGHGLPRGFVFDWCFVPRDFDPRDRLASGLSAGVLRAKLVEIAGRGATVFLAIDACFSGAVGIQEDGIITLASCLPDELSQELPQGPNGVFTKALVEALDGAADFNRDGVVTLGEVVAYVSTRVDELMQGARTSGSPAGRKGQHPTCVQPASIRSSLPVVGVPRPDGAGPFPSVAPTMPSLPTGPLVTFGAGPVR